MDFLILPLKNDLGAWAPKHNITAVEAAGARGLQRACVGPPLWQRAFTRPSMASLTGGKGIASARSEVGSWRAFRAIRTRRPTRSLGACLLSAGPTWYMVGVGRGGQAMGQGVASKSGEKCNSGEKNYYLMCPNP